jgi:hypothetical protein
MKKNLSKGIVLISALMVLLGTAVSGFLLLAKQMEEIDYGFDPED